MKTKNHLWREQYWTVLAVVLLALLGWIRIQGRHRVNAGVTLSPQRSQ